MDKSAGVSLCLPGQTGICLQLDPVLVALVGAQPLLRAPVEVTVPEEPEPL